MTVICKQVVIGEITEKMSTTVFSELNSWRSWVLKLIFLAYKVTQIATLRAVFMASHLHDTIFWTKFMGSLTVKIISFLRFPKNWFLALNPILELTHSKAEFCVGLFRNMCHKVFQYSSDQSSFEGRPLAVMYRSSSGKILASLIGNNECKIRFKVFRFDE